jgi:type I restriction enzyme M protein
MVEMVDPQLGETVLDPACGTGGFLTCAIEHIRRHYVKTPEDEQTMQASVRGVEKKPLPHLLCTTNMLLHGIDIPSNIRHDNTLGYLINFGDELIRDGISRIANGVEDWGQRRGTRKNRRT